jgi:hypothetical protein
VRDWATFAMVLLSLLTWSSVSGADVVCHGHQLLPTPRPVSSCNGVKPAVYKSQSGEPTAFVFPTDASPNATPDMESRVEIRAGPGYVLASKDYSSPKGANGYHVVQAEWTRDAQFFVFSLASSGGHSPWQLPIEVFSRERNAFFKFSDMNYPGVTTTARSTPAASINGRARSIVKGSGNCGCMPGTHFQSSLYASQR